ncbi:hypothetical protein C8T65DRAFT_741919 [Cerioporus squamosus]|nr:hypothetical protein C8T65DRAFT_741919 [Cerioporus squamosus]
MSSNDTIAQLITDETAFMVEDLTSVSAAVLLSYEYLIMLSAEVQLFWKLPVTGSSVIFVINRYLPLLVIWYTGPFPYPTYLEGCVATVWSKSIIEYLQYFPWAAFSALRVYALGNQNWWIASFVFLLSSLPAICHYIRTHWLYVYLNPAYGLLLVDYAGPVLSDLLVLAITWRATYRSRRAIADLGGRLSLSQVIFRDGTLYFMTLLALKTLHLAFGVVSIESPSVLYTSWFTTYEEPVTAILRCSTDSSRGSGTVTTVDTLNFNRVLGSISSSLPAPGEASSTSAFDPAFEERLYQETGTRTDSPEMSDTPQNVPVEHTSFRKSAE